MEKQIDPVSENATVVTEKKRYGKAGLGIIIILCAVIVFLGIYAFGMYRLIGVNKQLAVATAQMNTQLMQNQKDIQALQKAQTDAEQSGQRLQDDFTQQQTALAEIKNIQQTKNDDWTVAEARYLVNLANDNLQIGDNIPLVINLLQTADQELQGSTNPKLLPLRKALAADLATVKAIPTVDFTGVYLRLSALNDQVDKLPLPTKRPDGILSTSADISQAVWWKRGLQNTWAALQKIVVVRYNQPGVRPFILPDQQEFLYQNIHAMFEQAMSAVVHRQPEIYRASLLQAQQWIQKYFLADAPETQAQLKALTELQSINIRPALPNVTASLQAFREYTQTDSADQSGKTTN
jgi:uroporphyrin-3 C-methyltransferase